MRKRNRPAWLWRASSSRRWRQEPLEAPLQHLAHHRVVVARRQASDLMLNLRYWFLMKPSGPATIMAPTALVPWMWLLS